MGLATPHYEFDILTHLSKKSDVPQSASSSNGTGYTELDLMSSEGTREFYSHTTIPSSVSAWGITESCLWSIDWKGEKFWISEGSAQNMGIFKISLSSHEPQGAGHLVVSVTMARIFILEETTMESLIGKLTIPPGQFRAFMPHSEQEIRGRLQCSLLRLILSGRIRIATT